MEKIFFILIFWSLNIFATNITKQKEGLNEIIKYFNYSESEFKGSNTKYTLVDAGAEGSLEGYCLNSKLILVFQDGSLNFIIIPENTEILGIKIGTFFNEAQKKLGNIKPKKMYGIGDDHPSYDFIYMYNNKKIIFSSPYLRDKITEIIIKK